MFTGCGVTGCSVAIINLMLGTELDASEGSPEIDGTKLDDGDDDLDGVKLKLGFELTDG